MEVIGSMAAAAAALEEGQTPIPTTEADAPNDGATEVQSTVTESQWQAFQALLNSIYDFRSPDGWDPSKVFHRKVNKRVLPNYYEVIKEPIALSTIKARLNLKQYKDVPEIVRDFALIPHNAQVYNRPDAGVYQDALVIKKVLETELKKLVSTQCEEPSCNGGTHTNKNSSAQQERHYSSPV